MRTAKNHRGHFAAFHHFIRQRVACDDEEGKYRAKRGCPALASVDDPDVWR